MAGNHHSPLLPPFLQLPNEIQTHIIRQLDPISLFRLSETCTHLRILINPGPQERLEQLLMLECQARLGGEVVVYGSHCDLTLRASYLSEIKSWAGLRWACSSCLRLLPHSHFKNRSVFHVAQRKPHPDCLPREPTTGWRGSSSVERPIGNGILSAPPTSLYSVSDYSLAVTTSRNFDGDQYAIFVGADCQHWGYERHLRKCISCLYKGTMPSPRTYGLRLAGNTLEEFVDVYGVEPEPELVETKHITIPAVRTLCIFSSSMLARYFPGFLDSLAGPGEEPHSVRTARIPPQDYPREDHHEQFMVYCEGCDQWKEQRSIFVREQVQWSTGWQINEFFPIDMHIQLLDEHKDKGLCCGVCFLKDYGREAFIAKILPWFMSMVKSELGDEGSKISRTWGVMRDYLRKCQLSPESRQKYTEPLGELPKIYKLSTDDPKLSQLRRQLLPLVEACQEDPGELHVNRMGFKTWISYYEDLEYQIAWLKGIRERVENNPDLLADWVLERDSHPFNVLELPEK